jgi:hypothetical protein
VKIISVVINKKSPTTGTFKCARTLFPKCRRRVVINAVGNKIEADFARKYKKMAKYIGILAFLGYFILSFCSHTPLLHTFTHSSICMYILSILGYFECGGGAHDGYLLSYSPCEMMACRHIAAAAAAAAANRT